MVLELDDEPSLLNRCSMLGEEAYTSPVRLTVGSGHVRCAGGSPMERMVVPPILRTCSAMSSVIAKI